MPSGNPDNTRSCRFRVLAGGATVAVDRGFPARQRRFARHAATSAQPFTANTDTAAFDQHDPWQP